MLFFPIFTYISKDYFSLLYNIKHPALCFLVILFLEHQVSQVVYSCLLQLRAKTQIKFIGFNSNTVEKKEILEDIIFSCVMLYIGLQLFFLCYCRVNEIKEVQSYFLMLFVLFNQHSKIHLYWISCHFLTYLHEV